MYIHISLARQAAVRPPRNCTETSINYILKYYRTPSGETLEAIAKSIPKRSRINGNTSLQRWQRLNEIFLGRPQAPELTSRFRGSI